MLAQLAFNELKAKKVSIIQEITNDYSVGLASFFSTEFKNLGGTVLDGGKYNTGDTDFNAVLTNVKSQNPDVIFAPRQLHRVGAGHQAGPPAGYTAAVPRRRHLGDPRVHHHRRRGGQRGPS